jgi:hypothetical protein
VLIGRAQVGLGRLVAAQETFLKVVREQLPANASPVSKKAQADAKDELAAIEPRIASLRIALEGPGDHAKVTVKLDEQAVSPALIGVHRPIDPGKHVVAAYPLGRAPVQQEITLGDGEKKDVTLTYPEAPTDVGPKSGGDGTPPPPPPPDQGKGSAGLKYAGYAGIGVGAAGIVVGGVFTGLWASKKSEADSAFNACAKPCPAADQKHINDLDKAAASRGTVAIAGFVAGAVLAGGGVTLLILSNKKQEKPAAAFVTPYVTPNGFGLTGQF